MLKKHVGLLATAILAATALTPAVATAGPPLAQPSTTAFGDWPANPNWQSYVQGNDASTVKPVGATVASGSVDNPQALVTGNGVTTLTNVVGQAPPIVFLDYGREVGGLPFFNVQSVTPVGPATSVTMRAAYSELQRYLMGSAPSTTLVVPAAPGATNVNTASVTNFLVGLPLTIDTGAARETATITAVGTAAGTAGTTRTATNVGATNVRVSSVTGYAVGQNLLIDSGANAEQATVSAVGTAGGSTTIPSNSTNLAVTSTTTTGPSAAGAPSVNVASLSGFSAGMTVGIDTGASAETATVASTASTGLPVPLYPVTPNPPVANWVWNVSGATSNAVGPAYLRKDFTIADPSAVSVAPLRVNADDSANVWVNGNSLGQTTTGNNGWRTSMLVDIRPYLVAGNNVVAIQGQNVGAGSDAGSVISALELYSSGTLTNRYVTDTSWKALAGTPATGPAGWTTASFDDSSWGNAVISGAYGASPWGTSATTPSSTVTNTITFTAPLANAHATGTILGSITPAGVTNIKVASVSGFSAGQQITIDIGASRESATISSVGTAGAGGTGIDLTTSTTNAHNGAVLVDAVVAPAGATNVKVASVTGFAVGDTMLVDTGAAQETVTVTVVGTATATGTGITFTPALAQLHNGGTTVVDLGTGITVSTPFTLAHAAGVAIRGLGSGITFTPALAQAHATGATLTTSATTISGDANGNNGVGTDGSRADNFTLTTASGGTTVGNTPNLVQGGERWQAITLTTPGTVVLSGVGITLKHYNQGASAYQGYFISSDDTLNKIWYDGVYTDQTNSVLPGGVCSNAAGTTCSGSATILDGAKRDRRPWSGDLTTENRTMFVSLGYGPGASDVIRDTIGQFGSTPQSNGSICGQISNWINYPTGTVSCSFYSPTYSMYWSRGLQQQYLYTGDTAFVETQYQRMKNEIAYQRNSWNSTTGLTNASGQDWDFYDGSKCGTGCAVSATNMLYYDELAGAAWLAQQLALNDPGNANVSTWLADAATWSSQAADLKTAINSQLFNTGKGVYQLSSANNGTHLATSVPQDANSQAVVFGVAPSDKVPGILSYLKNNLWGTFGPQPYSPDAAYSTVISPFISGFELDARFASGDTSGALALTRLMWSQMVNQSSSLYTGTLWEKLGQNGDITDSNASLAHGWGTAPVFAFSNYLLGVKPTAPGFQAWRVAPQTGDLSWVQGQVPTPHGPIAVSWSHTNGILNLEVTAPSGTTGEIWVPKPAGQQILAPAGTSFLRNDSMGSLPYAVYGVAAAGTYDFTSISTTTTNLTAGFDPTQYGKSVTFTAAVSADDPGTGTPTGAVQFSLDGSPIGGPVALAGGVATWTTSTLAIGTHVIGAAYTPDASSWTASAASINHSVKKRLATTAALTSAGPVGFSAPWSLTATVSPENAGGTIAPTGSLQLMVDGVALGTPLPIAGGTVDHALTSRSPSAARGSRRCAARSSSAGPPRAPAVPATTVSASSTTVTPTTPARRAPPIPSRSRRPAPPASSSPTCPRPSSRPTGPPSRPPSPTPWHPPAASPVTSSSSSTAPTWVPRWRSTRSPARPPSSPPGTCPPAPTPSRRSTWATPTSWRCCRAV